MKTIKHYEKIESYNFLQQNSKSRPLEPYDPPLLGFPKYILN